MDAAEGLVVDEAGEGFEAQDVAAAAGVGGFGVEDVPRAEGQLEALAAAGVLVEQVPEGGGGEARVLSRSGEEPHGPGVSRATAAPPPIEYDVGGRRRNTEFDRPDLCRL